MSAMMSHSPMLGQLVAPTGRPRREDVRGAVGHPLDLAGAQFAAPPGLPVPMS
jgi:hypothetical protein